MPALGVRCHTYGLYWRGKTVVLSPAATGISPSASLMFMHPSVDKLEMQLFISMNLTSQVASVLACLVTPPIPTWELVKEMVDIKLTGHISTPALSLPALVTFSNSSFHQSPIFICLHS